MLVEAGAALAVVVCLALWHDRERVWVFLPPSLIHLAFDAAYRRRSLGAAVTRSRWFIKPLVAVVDPRKAGRVVASPIYADEVSPVWSAFWGANTPFLMHGNLAHRSQRKLAAFLLTPDFAEQARPHIRATCERWERRFDDGEWREVGMHALNELMWELIATLTTGEDTPDFRQTALDEIHHARTAGMAASTFGLHVLPPFARLARWRHPEFYAWEAFVRERIADQRSGARSTPILAKLCADMGSDSAAADGARASDDEVFGVIVALHMGGHHGPAAVTSWALFHLLRDHALLDEAKAKLDDDAHMAALLLEATRLYPAGVVSRFYRARANDDTLGVRRGESVVVPWYSFHRDEQINANAERFDPARKQAIGAFFPFGLGAHSCIGQRLVRPMFSEALRVLLGRLECRLDSRDLSFHAQLVTAEMDESMGGAMWARRPPAARE
ncbi:hypothetical protein KFE25_005390 [Diacronema lutheri]|uniref:Cytochrome P450 n=1 Tax=Diacronema lutheri TaxID=2081491 RepID=A0A8J5XUT7_DIALT|nr:hypothetical protein KFE25_005390 [Diacronema lutheri]